MVKNPPVNAGDLRERGLILGWEDLLEKGMATHSHMPAWRIPWIEKPGGLQSMGFQELDTTEGLSTHAQLLLALKITELSKINCDLIFSSRCLGFPVAQTVKHLPAMWET